MISFEELEEKMLYEEEERKAIQDLNKDVEESTSVCVESSSSPILQTLDSQLSITPPSRHNCDGIIFSPAATEHLAAHIVLAADTTEAASVKPQPVIKTPESTSKEVVASILADNVSSTVADNCSESAICAQPEAALCDSHNGELQSQQESLPELIMATFNAGLEVTAAPSQEVIRARNHDRWVVQTCSGILQNHYSLTKKEADDMAQSYLDAAWHYKVKDPVPLLEELGLSWNLQASSKRFVTRNVGDFLFRSLRNNARQQSTDPNAPPKRHEPDWHAIRQRIIEAAEAGMHMRGSELVAYWDHKVKMGIRPDDRTMRALAALAKAGQIRREGLKVYALADLVVVPLEKKELVSVESALRTLQSVVERCYGKGESWEAVVDRLLPMVPWWRDQRNPDALLGLADMIEERAKNVPKE